MKRKNILVMLVCVLVVLPAYALAMSHEDHSAHDMDHSKHEGMQMDHGDHKMDHSMHDSMQMQGGMIMLGDQEKDGVKANIHMKDVGAKMAEMGMDVTHHFMIALSDAQTGKSLDEGVVAVKITDPSGKEGKAIKLMGMQGHFGVDVTLKEKGEYHFKVASKLADGKTRTFHTHYEVK